MARLCTSTCCSFAVRQLVSRRAQELRKEASFDILHCAWTLCRLSDPCRRSSRSREGQSPIWSQRQPQACSGVGPVCQTTQRIALLMWRTAVTAAGTAHWHMRTPPLTLVLMLGAVCNHRVGVRQSRAALDGRGPPWQQFALRRAALARIACKSHASTKASCSLRKADRLVLLLSTMTQTHRRGALAAEAPRMRALAPSAVEARALIETFRKSYSAAWSQQAPSARLRKRRTRGAVAVGDPLMCALAPTACKARAGHHDWLRSGRVHLVLLYARAAHFIGRCRCGYQ